MRRQYREAVRYLDVDGVGRVSKTGLGTWQFGSRAFTPAPTGRVLADAVKEKVGRGRT
jgi:hypothetical protein